MLAKILGSIHFTTQLNSVRQFNTECQPQKPKDQNMKFCVTEDINNIPAYSDLILHKTEEKMNAMEYRKHIMHMTTIKSPNET